MLTPGNVDDRHPVPKLAKGLFGKLFGDKGYLSQPLAEHLLVTQGLHLITKLRKHTRNRLLTWSDKLLLRKRAIIETINDQLKNICQIEHSRHRSPINFLVNLMAGLIASTAINPKSRLSGCNHSLYRVLSLSRTHVNQIRIFIIVSYPALVFGLVL